MKSWRKIAVTLTLMALALSLSLLFGCGQQKAAPSKEGAKAGSAPAAQAKTYANADELYADLSKLPEAEIDKRLLEGALKEKVVRLYTTLDEQIIDSLKKEFEKTYPGVKVEYISGKETDLTSRATSEFRSGRFVVDILQITPGLFQLNKEFPFPKHYNIPLFKDYPKALYADYWLSTTMNPVIPAYNTKMVKKEDAPKNWDDFLDPKWKGKVAFDINPVQMVTTLVATRGADKAREYVKKAIVDNDGQVRKGHTSIGDMMIAGEFPIAGEQMLYNTETKISKGAPVEWIATDPMPVNISGMAIVNKAPNPYAAMLYAKFYASNENASRINASAGRIPVHPKVDPVFPRLKTFVAQYKDRFFPMSPENTGKYQKDANAIIKEFVEAKLKK